MGGKEYYVYILSNKYRTVLYIGVTSTLERRYFEHMQRKYSTSFTAQYNVHDLLYIETFSNPKDAIRREKQLKGWTRSKKLHLIRRSNPTLRNIVEVDDDE